MESTIATGPSTGSFVVDPDLLRELAVQRVDEALARVDAAARQQPVLLSRLLVPAEQHPALPAQDRRDADARLGAHQAPDDPCRARRARSRAARLSRRAPAPAPRARRAARSACPARRRTACLRVGVEQDHLQLAAVAGIDQARARSRSRCRGDRRARSAAARSPHSRRGSRRRARCRRQHAPPVRARRARTRRGRAPRRRVRALGEDRIRAQPLDRQLDQVRSAPTASATR